MYETIRYDLADHVLTLTLNRPDRLNAFIDTMGIELSDAIDRADADDGVRAIIVTGEGRGFCSGMDLAHGADTFNFDRLGLDDPETDWRDPGGVLSMRFHRSLKPVIAAINGPAVGVGATMTLAMDIRLVAEGAVIAFPFARRGITTESASTFFLPHLVGVSRAIEWCMTGRSIAASEAVASGLANSSHPPERLLAAARELANEIAAGAPVAMTMIRRMLWDGLRMADPMEAHLLESRVVYNLGRAPDSAEGVCSFLEKRAPHYTGSVSRDLPPFFRERIDRMP